MLCLPQKGPEMIIDSFTMSCYCSKDDNDKMMVKMLHISCFRIKCQFNKQHAGFRTLCLSACICVKGSSDTNIHMHVWRVCVRVCVFGRQRVDKQMDDWEKQRLKVDSSNTTLGGEREKEERMDGGKRGRDRVEGQKGREGPRHADREGVLKRRWEIVTFISFTSLKQQVIGWLWLILWLGLNMALGLTPGEWLKFDLAQYYN